MNDSTSPDCMLCHLKYVTSLLLDSKNRDGGQKLTNLKIERQTMLVNKNKGLNAILTFQVS
jgi:hypothetical protein